MPLHKCLSADDAMNASEISVESAEHNLRGTSFRGSFATITQRNEVIPKRPWYRRKSYFTEGWQDAYVWRAGVSMHLLDELASTSFTMINRFARS